VLKRITYMFLVLALLLVSSKLVFAQKHRYLFEDKLDRANSIFVDNPKLAIDLAMEARDIAEEYDDLWGVAIGLSSLGYFSYEVEDFRASFLNYLKALEVLKAADTVDLSNQIVILNELSRIQSEFNNHDEAIKYGKEAWDLAKKHIRKNRQYAQQNDQLHWLVEIPYYMAIEYQAKGAHQTAGKILFELWETAENKDDVYAYSQVLNELGIVKMKNGEYSAAQEYFGIVASSNEVDNWDKANAYHNLATTYLNQGEFEKAENYFLIGLNLTTDLDDPESLFISYQDIGELEYKRGDLAKAIEYWELALNTFEEIETNPDLYSIYNWLQRAYMDIDIEKAKDYNLKYTQLNDFYVKNQTIQRELEAQNRQDLSNWIDQEKNNRVRAEQRQQFIKQFWPVFLGVGLLFIFSLIIGVRYYRTVRANKALAKQQMGFTAVHTRDEAA